MRTLSLAAALGAGLYVVLPVNAVAAPMLAEIREVPAGRAPCAAQVAVRAVKPDADVLEAVAGAYRLSNGRRLDIAQQNERLLADFGRWPRVVLVATSQSEFVSRDGRVTLRYLDDAQGERIVLSYPADAYGRYSRSC